MVMRLQTKLAKTKDIECKQDEKHKGSIDIEIEIALSCWNKWEIQFTR